MSYLAAFGLAPYFKYERLSDLNEVPYYSISFNVKTSRVIDRYLTSQFLGHATAENRLSCFLEATSDLDQSKTIQISLDGPSVNLKFMRRYQEERKKKCLYTLSNNFIDRPGLSFFLK